MSKIFLEKVMSKIFLEKSYVKNIFRKSYVKNIFRKKLQSLNTLQMNYLDKFNNSFVMYSFLIYCIFDLSTFRTSSHIR
jgi:hypothetical protein